MPDALEGDKTLGVPTLEGASPKQLVPVVASFEVELSPREDGNFVKRSGPVAGKPQGPIPKGTRSKRDHVTNKHDTVMGHNTPKGRRTTGELSTRRRRR